MGSLASEIESRLCREFNDDWSEHFCSCCPLWREIMTQPKQIQIDWLDTWFKPRVKVVGYGAFIATVTELQSQQARIFSVDVDKTKGEYKISYQPTKTDDKPDRIHEAVATTPQGKTKKVTR